MMGRGIILLPQLLLIMFKNQNLLLQKLMLNLINQ